MALPNDLIQLARLYGVEVRYTDMSGRTQRAGVEPLLEVLRALGAKIQTPRDAPGALREHRRLLSNRVLEPVTVAWNGRAPDAALKFPNPLREAKVRCEVELEEGGRRSFSWVFKGAKRIPLPERLPFGYHRLTLQQGKGNWRTLLLCAPDRAYGSPEERRDRSWGLFLPLHALSSRRDWGAGDLSDLESFGQWTGRFGARVIATLPLLSLFLDTPFQPSPYAPVSRIFWSEFWVDPTRLPEWSRAPSARAQFRSPGFQREWSSLRAMRRVDYKRSMALKRQILEILSDSFFRQAGRRREDLLRFIKRHPQVEEYARFRAVTEKLGRPWPQWPDRLRQGTLKAGDAEEKAIRYHLYGQWAAHQQIGEVSDRFRASGLRLYMDFPLGTHPDGYDVWKERALFVQGMNGGAPADTFFTRGQDWGFPALHPERIRQDHYRYLLACLRHQMQWAGLLRIDHVMGLHRLFWVPRGRPPREGVYVRYPAEELYALLCLESHRSRCVLVGEDLGTVPRQVRASMARRGLKKMFVVQYEARPNFRRPLPSPSAGSVASLNTHDMPPFASFWGRGRGRVLRFLRAFLRREGRLRGKGGRAQALEGCLKFLSGSRAGVVLVGLEDLWGEREPQNVPGTGLERPNWRRKARYRLERFSKMKRLQRILNQIQQLRLRAGV